MSRFYELYRSISHCGDTAEEQGTVLLAVAQACRELRAKDSSSEAWLHAAEDCLHEVAGRPSILARAITEWLTVEDDFPTAKALIHEASVRYLRASEPLHFDFKEMDEGRVVLAGCRICALRVCPPISLGWALSLCMRGSSEQHPPDAALHLVRYHIEEFPGTTLRLLKAERSPFREMNLGKEALAALESDAKAREALPQLRELAMTPDMRLLMRSLKRAESREINRQAEDNSVFSNLFTSYHFKYSNRTAVEISVSGKTHETTMEMQSFGFSVELPLSEGTDPIAGVMRRNAMWSGSFK